MTKYAQFEGLPTRDQILEFIKTSKEPAGKREIAREFGLRGNEKITLKALLKDMTDEGLIDMAPGRAFHKMGGVPKVTVLKIVAIDGDQAVAVPEHWEAEGIPLPKIRVIEAKGKRGALGIGERILARTEERGNGLVAHIMKKLAKGSEQILGVVESGENGRYWLKSVDKKARFDTQIGDVGDAKAGELVLAELTGNAHKKSARVTQVLGDPFAPKSFSLIAIHKYGIPFEMPEATEREAERVRELPVTNDHREDLRHLPIIAIDPRDARDFDDAIWATANADTGGFDAIVAIADVSYYVRPGSALDHEASKRGNSVYFPDLVVPMLPHALSSDKCSLRAGEDRAVLACHLSIGKTGQVASWRFTRAVARIAANIPYPDAQAAIDGQMENPLLETALKPLWACWRLLAKARDKRGPLELNLPEKRITLDEQGRVTGVAVREQLEAHRLVEDFMIAANVAAAKALEAKKSSLIYRAHEPPSAILGKIVDEEVRPQIMEAVLRSQTQAYYGPNNVGHFGLSLGSYAHFTSPIRRYADLIVHRALVSSYGLEMPKPKLKDVEPTTGLTEAAITKLAATAEAISRTERRAMEAERETTDRYIAAYLSAQVGQIIQARITGVQNFGFFATVEGVGGDGLVPVSTLGKDYFHYDEASQTLIGEKTRQEYRPGMRLELRLAEANPISGSLRFELPEGGSYSPDRFKHKGKPKTGKYDAGKRGRPGNIRHQGKKR